MTDAASPPTEIGAADEDAAADGTAERDPWEGIPGRLLDGGRSYDTDTAGGCG